MVFWRRRPIDPGPVMLLEPADGAVTAPLQRFRLVSEEEEAGADDAREETPARGPGGAWWSPERLGIDRSQPEPVVFRWLPPPGLRRAVAYDLLIGRDPELSAPLAIQGIPQPLARVRHLFVDTDYYWKVVAVVRGEVVAVSPVHRFRTHPALPRWLRVPEITNVRDLGGWSVPGGRRVRQGMVYRSSELNGHLALSPEGVDVLVREVGLKTDLDLRADAEEPAPALPAEWVRHITVPVLPYDRILDPEMRRAFARLFEIFAEPDAYPILMHCWAGADRAATVSFMLHAALGVQSPDLATDYELSSLSVWGVRSRHGPGFTALVDALATFAESPTDTVNVQAVNYLRAAGVTDAVLDAIRGLLLETAPAPMPETRPW